MLLRLLEEEFQKREELERLQTQQEEMLRAEREQKAVLESDRLEQERLLSDAKHRLQELELERLAAEEKMQVSRWWYSRLFILYLCMSLFQSV